MQTIIMFTYVLLTSSDNSLTDTELGYQYKKRSTLNNSSECPLKL